MKNRVAAFLQDVGQHFNDSVSLKSPGDLLANVIYDYRFELLLPTYLFLCGE